MAGSGTNPLFPNSAWRFFLPTPSPDRIVCFGDGDATRLARELPGQVDDASHDGAGPADLVVSDDPGAIMLRQMHDRLQPGGAIYTEYHRCRRWRQARRLHRLVSEAGFADIRIFSVSPRRTFHQTTWWIPLYEPTAVTYIADTRKAELATYPRWRRIAGQRYLNIVGRMSARLAAAPWWLYPGLRHQLCLVARRPNPVTVDPGRGSEIVAKVCPEVGSGADPEPVVLLRVGGTATDRAIAVIVDSGRSEPVGVAKLPVLTSEILEAEREAAMLAALQGIPGVPELLHHWRGTGYAGLAQSFVAGRPMDTVVTMSELPELAADVTSWLCELALATAGTADTAWLNELSGRSLAELESSLVGAAGLGQLVATSRRILTFERPLSPVAQHRDLGPWNILRGPNRSIGVIDWVDGTTDGVPMADLVHFLTHLVHGASGGYRRERFDETVSAIHDSTTRVGQVIAACQRTYASRVGLADEDVVRLRVLTWVLDVLRQDRNDRASSLYMALWRDEVERATTKQPGW